jgi:farnesyl diphosphate synthase
MPVESLSARWLARFESAFAQALSAPERVPSRLHAAMRYAALGGGKRLRPQLVYASGHLAGADEAALDFAAVAVELIHAFSLVHDDLPAMDDDDLRRGRATVHVAFDEATAILAGDALQTLAFETLANTPVAAETRIALIRTLAEATGASGMCGGQQLDMDGADGAITLADLELLHRMKTGALIGASVRLGALIGGADAGLRQTLDEFAGDLGLAFQIRDLGQDRRQGRGAAQSDLSVLAGNDRREKSFAGVVGKDAGELVAAGRRGRRIARRRRIRDRAGELNHCGHRVDV